MTATSAEVIADSISPNGSRVTTMLVTMHRFVLAEFNTHRVFSRNSASSRAIPVEKMVARYLHEPAYPLSFPREQAGMQGGDELDGQDREDALALLRQIHDLTYLAIADYVEAHPDKERRLHKSVLNRPLEPFLWHTVIVTSTEWENFFGLRCHKLAQPEIQYAAQLMRGAYEDSEPDELDYGEWHAPFAPVEINLERRLKRSAACCAWVSTMSHDGDHSDEAVDRMFDRLSTAVPMHASPFEHQCTPMPGARVPHSQEVAGNLFGWAQLRHMVEKDRLPWQVLRDGRPGSSQPLPTASDHPIAHRMVQDDLEGRLRLGVERYGKPLQPFNGRDSLRDAYEEVLDLAVYLRTALYEHERG